MFSVVISWLICGRLKTAALSLPDVVSFAVRLLVAYKARTGFVQRLLAVSTAKTSNVPLEVGRHSQDVLVKDLITAPGTDRGLTTSSHQSGTLAAAAGSCRPPFHASHVT